MTELTVAIPCYNEVENVARIPDELVPELRKLGLSFEILIVDDGSRDGTAEAAEGLRIPELRVVRHPRNKGLGAGIETMFREARGNLLVTLDADLTFEPKDIAKLLERYRKGDVDFVIGSHGLAGYAADIPRYRVLVSRLANWIYSVLSGREVKGVSSIFRLYRTEIVRTLPVTTSGYETPAETFFRLVKSGYRFAEVPTPLGSRRFGTSKLNYKKEIPRHLRLVLDILMGRLDGRPRRRFDFRSWVPGLVAAVAIGIIYFLPNALVPEYQRAQGYDLRDYHPLSLNAPTLDELMSYGSRIREVIDGHIRDGDAYIAGYKDRPTMWGNSFLTAAIGLPSRLAGVRDPTPLFVFGDALFPALALLVLYGMMRTVITDRWVAGAAAFAVIAFPNFSAFRFGLPGAGLEGIFDLLARMFDPGFSRLPVPSPGMVIFVGFLWALIIVFKRPTRLRTVVAGILLGLSYPTYFYYGVFSWVAVGLLAVATLGLRSWASFRRAVMMMVVGAVVSLPSIIKLISLRTIPNAAELQARVGLEFGRIPRISVTSLTLVIFLVVLLLILGRRLGRAPEAIVLSTLLVATQAVVNLQLIVGFNVQPDHWGSRVSVYIYALCILVAIVWVWRVVWKDELILRRAALLGMIFFFGIGIAAQARASWITAAEYVIPRDLQESFRWIDLNTPRDAVIVSPSSQTAAYVPFFTHANIYFAPACYTLASNAEVRSRWLELAAAFGVSEEKFRDALLGDADWTRNPIRGRELDPSYMLFCDTYTRYQNNAYVGGDSRRPVPEEVAVSLLADHRAALARPVPNRLRFDYRADYVFFGPSEKLISNVRPERYENLKSVY